MRFEVSIFFSSFLFLNIHFLVKCIFLMQALHYAADIENRFCS
jgi:hypothetical protein